MRRVPHEQEGNAFAGPDDRDGLEGHVADGLLLEVAVVGAIIAGRSRRQLHEGADGVAGAADDLDAPSVLDGPPGSGARPRGACPTCGATRRVERAAVGLVAVIGGAISELWLFLGVSGTGLDNGEKEQLAYFTAAILRGRDSPS